MSTLLANRHASPLQFIILVIAAFILSYIPVLSWPFSWMMTFFHEISHGMVALLTGGSIVSIRLRLNGSGLCTTTGGIAFMVSLAGYLGAVLWGVAIYLMADRLNKRFTDLMAWLMIVLVTLAALFWGRDVITLLIMGVLIFLLLGVMKLQASSIIKIALKFIGVFILLDAVKAPLSLIDGRHYGDGASLADLTGVPELIWVLLWFGVALYGLYFLWGSANSVNDGHGSEVL
ncbi:MAG: M50 family metallopeptidase [Mariprofundus sp.]|nr:M50 family metallopeptidase [Mariprofundus sp.]